MKKYIVPETNWKMFFQSVNELPEPFFSAMDTTIFYYIENKSQKNLPKFKY